ncbi:MAG: MarR family transcriptional regulator [Bacteroidota bacterium]
MRIEEAIKQENFQSPMQRASINIIYTAGWLNQQTTHVLRPFDISVQQFNILRILRGRKGKPATVKLLTERMLDKMSNASRLVEKLRKKGYVERTECHDDRRRVDIHITSAGIEVCEQASKALEENMYKNFQSLTPEEADRLSELLDQLRTQNNSATAI